MFLSIDTPIIDENSTLLDRLGLGGQTFLLGMLIVFAMLLVIYLAMLAMRAVLGGKGKDAKTSVPAPEPVPAALPQEKPSPAVPDDTQLVAAITAAIAAYTGEAPSAFRVVSFKKR